LPKPLIPDWFPDHHPFYLPASVAARVERDFNPARIFLNIPYAAKYSSLEVAVLSTATAYDLEPIMSKEKLRLEVRMRKIVELILSSRFGFTDLTYSRRMNMPFELGLLLAWGKETFVISSRPTSTVRARSSRPGSKRRSRERD
jgi:hypothetical protein